MRNFFIIIFAIAALGLGSCTHTVGQDKKDTNQSPDKTEKTVEPIHLDYNSFLEKVWNFEQNPDEWVYEGELPCVIDFYADWCKPCKMVAPIMADLSKEYEGRLHIYKVDVDDERQLASIFGIRSIPSVLFSPLEGKPMMQPGALSKDAYKKIIDENLINQ